MVGDLEHSIDNNGPVPAYTQQTESAHEEEPAVPKRKPGKIFGWQLGQSNRVPMSYPRQRRKTEVGFTRYALDIKRLRSSERYTAGHAGTEMHMSLGLKTYHHSQIPPSFQSSLKDTKIRLREEFEKCKLALRAQQSPQTRVCTVPDGA